MTIPPAIILSFGRRTSMPATRATLAGRTENTERVVRPLSCLEVRDIT
jgi:hypothetical protein